MILISQESYNLFELSYCASWSIWMNFSSKNLPAINIHVGVFQLNGVSENRKNIYIVKKCLHYTKKKVLAIFLNRF